MNIHNIRSPLSAWVGGKFKLAKAIIPLIPQHRCYIEPFCGAAWIFFKKDRSPCEVINDINQDVTNLYRMVRHHPEEFYLQMQYMLFSRSEFNRLKATDPAMLTEIQRAVRFYFLQKSAYGGKIVGATFGTSKTRNAKLNLSRVKRDIDIAHKRLDRVTIENLPYLDVIERYDDRQSFFYLDPPYYGCEDYYGKLIFERKDFQRLVDQLKNIKGKFLLSINDTPEIREIFDVFEIDTVDTSYSLALKNNNAVSELLIRNY